MARISKKKQEVWDRLKNGIPPADDSIDNPVFNVDGTMMYIKDFTVRDSVRIYKLSTPWQICTATEWPPSV